MKLRSIDENRPERHDIHAEEAYSDLQQTFNSTRKVTMSL